MRISQDFANDIANKLAEKLDKAIKAAYAEYSSYVYNEYIKQTPKEVIACFKKHPEWFASDKTICFSGHGFSYEYVTVEKSVIENGSNGHANLTLNKEIASSCISLKRTHDDLVKERSELKREIKQALLTLRSFSEIKKQFPEAAKYLPNTEKRELIVNLDVIRSKLKTA